MYFGALESLRGVAALSIALSHALWLNPIHFAGFVQNSYLMVDLFFVLSGFVMCHAYGERIRNRIELRDFLLLRLGRLYPLHVALLAVWVAIGFTASLPAVDNESAFAHDGAWALTTNLLLVHSLGLHRQFTLNRPSWSISTEFYAYAAFAAIVLALGPHRHRWRLPIFIGVAAASLAILLVAGRTDLNITLDLGFIRCTQSFFLGAAAYLAFASLSTRLARRLRAVAPYVAAAALAAAAIYLTVKEQGPTDFAFPPLAAIAIVALAASPGSAIDRALRTPVLSCLGAISYSIYMTHYLVSRIFGYLLESLLGYGRVLTDAGYWLIVTDAATGTTALIFYVAAVVAVSHGTFVWIEDRCRRKAKAFVARLHEPTAIVVATPDAIAVRKVVAS